MQENSNEIYTNLYVLIVIECINIERIEAKGKFFQLLTLHHQINDNIIKINCSA